MHCVGSGTKPTVADGGSVSERHRSVTKRLHVLTGGQKLLPAGDKHQRGLRRSIGRPAGRHQLTWLLFKHHVERVGMSPKRPQGFLLFLLQNNQHVHQRKRFTAWKTKSVCPASLSRLQGNTDSESIVPAKIKAEAATRTSFYKTHKDQQKNPVEDPAD